MSNAWKALAALVLAAMASCSNGALEPQPLTLDALNCARCGMMISTAAHAAQAVAPGQDARFYDDHGCLARDAAALPTTARLFVQHDGGSGWLEAAEAFFARPREARTPMSYGLVAFSSREAAAHADRDGRAWRWADVLASVTP